MPYTWTDDPLTTDTPIKTIHIEELRDAINKLSNESICNLHNVTVNSDEYTSDNTNEYKYVYNSVNSTYQSGHGDNIPAPCTNYNTSYYLSVKSNEESVGHCYNNKYSDNTYIYNGHQGP